MGLEVEGGLVLGDESVAKHPRKRARTRSNLSLAFVWGCRGKSVVSVNGVGCEWYN